MILSLNQLPEEILHSILCHSHPRSATALQQTSCRFGDVTKRPLLWRHYCRTYYKFWDRRHDIHRKFILPASSVDWKALFILRYQIDGSVTQLLDSILASQAGRIEKFRAVIEFGYDAKDTLLRNSQVQDGEDHLARRCVLNQAISPISSVLQSLPVFLEHKILCPCPFDLSTPKYRCSRVG